MRAWFLALALMACGEDTHRPPPPGGSGGAVGSGGTTGGSGGSGGTGGGTGGSGGEMMPDAAPACLDLNEQCGADTPPCCSGLTCEDPGICSAAAPQ